MEKILEVKNLTKYYKDVLGVKNINFELYRGEIFGFIGPNGAGKSTTIRSILNLINKTSGEVLFKGKQLTKDNLELKKLIGYLPSEVRLYEDLTVKDLIDFHLKFFDKDFSKRREELVKRLKLDENKKIEDLSLGNLKKVGIVLAFVHGPQLLILDEPTSGLDPLIQQEFYNLLLEEKEKGTTIFYSTHVLSEISKICDRVGIIKSGNLIKIEPIKDLIDKSLTYVTITSKDCEKIINDLKLDIKDYKDNTISFKNFMESNELLKAIVKYDIDKIYIEPASIEDVFMHYYK
ncbi:MAG: ABC transporter ATP-binding protein [Clostridia bacterium]|nr:ABC transporter ATP-binding protein [Clostridia bacterium]